MRLKRRKKGKKKRGIMILFLRQLAGFMVIEAYGCTKILKTQLFLLEKSKTIRCMKTNHRDLSNGTNQSIVTLVVYK